MEDLGRMLAGRYKLVEPLGQGSMGTVWRAHDEQLDRDVAVKELRLPDNLDPSQRETWIARVDREARAAGRLRHPNIITVHDRITGEDGRPWIVMELIHGRSLDDIIKTQGPLPSGQVAHLGRQILSALDAAHQAGITHRDIKPANVLLEGDRAVLTDFGIAAIDGDPSLTGAGAVLGTPAFMSPEQVHGLPAGPASDLWSVGATLYTAVEGHPPFPGASPSAVFASITTQEPAHASHAGPLEPVLGALLRKNAQERPAIPQLQAMLAGLPTGTPFAPSHTSTRSRTALIVGAALAAVALLGGLIYAFPTSSSSRGNGPTSAPTASGRLRTPMQLLPVQTEGSGQQCAAGETSSQDRTVCYRLAPGFTVSTVKEISVRPPDPHQGQTSWSLSVSLLPADANRFYTLTQQAYTAYQRNMASPSSQIAVQVDGQVVMAPEISNGPISDGRFEIYGPSGTFSEQHVQQLFHHLTGH